MPLKILMVCLGNICRSPLAEGILKARAEEAGVTCMVDSAGTGNWHIGEPPHEMSQRIAREHNIDISRQRARQFMPLDMRQFDRIYFMDQQNLNDARRMAGTHWVPEKASLLLEVLPEAGVKDVPDPYFGGFEGYRDVFDLIDTACRKIVSELRDFDRSS